jgi:hypothetical protein
MGSGRECWGGSVTVISIQLCVFFVSRVELGGGQGGNVGMGV